MVRRYSLQQMTRYDADLPRRDRGRLFRRSVSLVLVICASGFAAGCRAPATLPEVVDGYAPQFVRDDGPGLAIAVLQRGEVVLESCFGRADLRDSSAVGPDTCFYLASVSKPFTAMAVMLLVQDGRIELEDPVTGHFPEAPASWSGITVHHLLTHQSGLREYLELPAVVGWTNQDVLDFAVGTAPEFPPGHRYAYSNTGYVLLAMLVERVSGTPFDVFVRNRIFAPLGMQRSVVYGESRPVVPDRAVGYLPDGALHDYPLRTMGDGGFFCSLRDMETWVLALGDSRMLSAEALELVFTSHAELGYGYGWFVGELRGRRRLHHAGALVGYATHVTWIPEEQLAVIVLSNGTFRDEVPELAYRVLSFCLRD